MARRDNKRMDGSLNRMNFQKADISEAHQTRRFAQAKLSATSVAELRPCYQSYVHPMAPVADRLGKMPVPLRSSWSGSATRVHLQQFSLPCVETHFSST